MVKLVPRTAIIISSTSIWGRVKLLAGSCLHLHTYRIRDGNNSKKFEGKYCKAVIHNPFVNFAYYIIYNINMNFFLEFCQIVFYKLYIKNHVLDGFNTNFKCDNFLKNVSVVHYSSSKFLFKSPFSHTYTCLVVPGCCWSFELLCSNHT